MRRALAIPGSATPTCPRSSRNTIDSLAALHAAFWESNRFAPTGDLAWVADRSADYGSSADLIGFAVKQLGDRLPEKSRELAAVYLPRAERVPGLLSRGPRTFVHGDPHLGNMFADGATPGLLDWALIGFAPGLRDVAYFLGGSVPTELRRRHERRLVERYCLRLADSGIAVDPDDAWGQYRSQLLTAWIAAVFTAGMGSKFADSRGRQIIDDASRRGHRRSRCRRSAPHPVALTGDLGVVGCAERSEVRRNHSSSSRRAATSSGMSMLV